MNVTIYHNPRCSKSRQTLKLLEENGVSPTVVLYLNTPPSGGEIASICTKLSMSPREILRKGEAVFKELKLSDPDTSDEDVIDAMTAHPILIERPIVVVGDKAVIGRPPENVLGLIA